MDGTETILTKLINLKTRISLCMNSDINSWEHLELALLVRRNQRAWLQSQGSSSGNCGLNAIWLGFEPSVTLILFSNSRTLTGDQTLSLIAASVNKGTWFTAKRSYHQPHNQGPFGANCLWECRVPSRSLSSHVQLFVWLSLNDCGVFPLGFFPCPASLCHLIQDVIHAARSLEFHKRWSDAQLRHMSEGRTRVRVFVMFPPILTYTDTREVRVLHFVLTQTDFIPVCMQVFKVFVATRLLALVYDGCD